MIGCEVMEYDKIVGSWVMECEQIDCPKAMEYKKIVGTRVKKRAN